MSKARMRVLSSVLILSTIGYTLGYWLDSNVPGVFGIPGSIAGSVAGALLGLSLGLYLVAQRRRWIAIAALSGFITIAFAFGGCVTTLAMFGAILVTFSTSAGILSDLYNGNANEAIRHHFRLLISVGGITVIDNGRIMIPSTQPPHFGPRLVNVRPGNVAVMMNYGQVTRYCGPSVFRSNDFEYVSHVLPTTRVHRSILISDVLTIDRIPVDVDLSYNFGLAISNDTITGKNSDLEQVDGSRGLTNDEILVIRQHFESNFVDIQSFPEIVEGVTRSAIASASLQVYQDDYAKLASEIQSQVDVECKKQGVLVERVTITRLLSRTIAGLQTEQSEDPAWCSIQSLDGQQFKSFHRALLAAFTDETLAQMVTFNLDVNLTAVAGGSNLRATAYNLIDWSLRNGRLPDLIQGALNENPKNPALLDFVATLEMPSEIPGNSRIQ